jgi:hypothetical protein
VGVEVIRPVPTDTGGVLEGRTRLLGVQHCYRELLGRAAPRAIERVFEMEATAILQGQHPAVGRHDSVEVLPCRFDQRDVIDADTEAVVRHTAELQGAPKCGQVDQAGGLLHRLSFPDAAHLRGRPTLSLQATALGAGIPTPHCLYFSRCVGSCWFVTTNQNCRDGL